jgi:hypothetical protein
MRFPEDDASKALGALAAEVYRVSIDAEKRYRPEDVISAAAAFVGECVMREAGDFDFERHTFDPGQAVFSPKVTGLLCGNEADWNKMPDGRCTFRRLYVLLTSHPEQPWSRESFPDVRGIFSRYAAGRAKGVSWEWGTAVLSVPPNHYPSKRPLAAAFALRNFVRRRWPNENLTAEALLVMAELALVMIMTQMRPKIEPAIGLLLALETINSMAKTAPILRSQMLEWYRERGVDVSNLA